MKKIKKYPNRAWIEIDSNNLLHNIVQIKKVIPNDCKIMAVIKANAYGHGMIEIATKLLEIGITDFAVATLEEGIKLRKNNINGNILILGYTHINEIEKIIKYDLIQTIVDYNYAKKISKIPLNEKLKVHIKINTGMNRLGESYKNTENIKKIYTINNIQVLGIYTHLCVADNIEQQNIDFTNQQINNFHNLINNLENSGYKVGNTHIQASYGILNYPNLKCDYVRPGIIMYGAHNAKNNIIKKKIKLKPVLSLKARITSIRDINENETVGYGRVFTATKHTKIATVSIGYADGYPTILSYKKMNVLVHKKSAEIVGRICMDQLMVDISNIKNVKPGDIVTLIGKNISIEEISEKAEISPYELLSRLGERLERIVTN